MFCEEVDEEFCKLPSMVMEKFKSIILVLERDGFLKEPEAKKLGSTGLFEIRVRVHGQWRALYAYYYENVIVVLSLFKKKAQKTPEQEIKKALNRLNMLLK